MSTLEAQLQQSIFRMHISARAPFSKAPQAWERQLESWSRSLIWAYLSRGTSIQPGKLSWYTYSSIGEFPRWFARLVTWTWAKSATPGKGFWCSLVYSLAFCQHNTTDLGPGLSEDLADSHALRHLWQEIKRPGGRATCSRLWYDDVQHIIWARRWSCSGKQSLLKAVSD